MPTNRLEEYRIATPDGRLEAPWLEEGESSPSNAWLEKIEEILVSHPTATLVAAVALGLTLGWLGKRK